MAIVILSAAKDLLLPTIAKSRSVASLKMTIHTFSIACKAVPFHESFMNDLQAGVPP